MFWLVCFFVSYFCVIKEFYDYVFNYMHHTTDVFFPFYSCNYVWCETNPNQNSKRTKMINFALIQTQTNRCESTFTCTFTLVTVIYLFFNFGFFIKMFFVNDTCATED